jgi:phospholipase C
MPSPGYIGASDGAYYKKHNPASYYTSIRSAYATNAVPLGTTSTGALASDLAANHLRRYSFIAPNICQDEHSCAVAFGDRWLRAWIPKILASPAYRAGTTALFLTYDEGASDNRVYTVVASPPVKPGTTSRARFDHYSLLKTQESLLGLRCLGHACDSATASMRKAFGPLGTSRGRTARSRDRRAEQLTRGSSA